MNKSTRKPWTNITRCYVAMLLKQGSYVTDDQLYEKLAGEAGLYGVAFFGFKRRPLPLPHTGIKHCQVFL